MTWLPALWPTRGLVDDRDTPVTRLMPVVSEPVDHVILLVIRP